jgi:hypothetical protein
MNLDVAKASLSDKGVGGLGGWGRRTFDVGLGPIGNKLRNTKAKRRHSEGETKIEIAKS